VTARRRRRLPGWTAWAIAWVLLFGLWMLLAGTLAVSEIVVGVVAAAVAATAVQVVLGQRLVRFRPDPRWFLRGWIIPWRAVLEFGLLVMALWRAVALRRRVIGRFRSVPFPVGGRDSRSAARRALFTVGASFAPNTYVVDFEEERVLVHRLVPPHPVRTEDIVP
jgi:hypothetical protein